MRNVLMIAAIAAMCCGCASTGRIVAIPVDLDLRSDKRVAIEESAPKGELASAGLVAKLADIISLKPGRLRGCLARIEWGRCPKCDAVVEDE